VLKQLFHQASQRDRQRFWIVSAIVLLALPWIVGSIGGNYWVRVLDFALLYIVLALGLNVVIGFAGLLDLGYIAFYAVGAYSYALLASPNFLRLPPFFLRAFISHCGARSSSPLSWLRYSECCSDFRLLSYGAII
jgi:branched-chain amino acid transport system permease protein